MVRRAGAIARLITGCSVNHMQQQLWGETAEYVDNAVDVDEVDDDKEGAATRVSRTSLSTECRSAEHVFSCISQQFSSCRVGFPLFFDKCNLFNHYEYVANVICARRSSISVTKIKRIGGPLRKRSSTCSVKPTRMRFVSFRARESIT